MALVTSLQPLQTNRFKTLLVAWSLAMLKQASQSHIRTATTTLDFVIGSVDATVASGCIYENSQTISSNYSITSGKNAMSAGPITISSGVTVTVTSGAPTPSFDAAP